MTQKQPEALRLATQLQNGASGSKTQAEAAAELRCLHEVNGELLEALKSITEMYGYEDSNIELARKFYEAKCLAGAAIAKAEGEQK